MPELVKIWLDTHVDLEPEGGQWWDAGQHFVSHDVADKLAQHGATFPDRETPAAAPLSVAPTQPAPAAPIDTTPTNPAQE